jgi:hypothetical protein
VGHLDHAAERGQDFLTRAKRYAPFPVGGNGASLFRHQAMSYRLSYGTVRESPRRVIHVLRVEDEILEALEIDDLAERMCERLESRGELTAEIVVVQGDSKETLRLFGSPYAVGRVRTAMFNAAVRWVALTLD